MDYIGIFLLFKLINRLGQSFSDNIIVLCNIVPTYITSY